MQFLLYFQIEKNGPAYSIPCLWGSLNVRSFPKWYNYNTYKDFTYKIYKCDITCMFFICCYE